jgi:RHS repeat-associated protein
MTGPANLSQFAINRFGAADTIVDAFGHQTSIQRDVRFPILASGVTLSNGYRTATYLNARALPDSVKEFNIFGDTVSAKTTYVWHTKWDAPTAVTSPTGLLTQAQYDSTTGDLQWQQAGTNTARRVQYGYFSATGLLQSITPPSPSDTTKYEYDGWGNASATVNPRGMRSSVAHDAIGRDSVVMTPIDSLASSSVKRIRTYQYDPMSRVLVGVDSAPLASGSSNWQSTRVITAYDVEGQPLSVTRRVAPDSADLQDIVTVATYDAAGRLTSQVDPNKTGSATIWRYAPSGRAVMIVRPTGTDSVEFDLLGRPVHRLISGATAMPTTADEQVFGYDAVGNLVTANNRYALISRGYFPNGLLRADTLHIGNSDLSFGSGVHEYVVGYAYDRDGRRVSFTRPTQLSDLGLFSSVTTYDYDPETGALSHLFEPSLGLFTYNRYLDGSLSALSRPDGSSQSYAYRSDGLPSGRLESNGATTFHSDNFTFDGRGKILAAQSTTLGTAVASAFGYAGLGGALAANGPTSAALSETYTRDPLGNVLRRSVSGELRAGDYANSYEQHSTRLSSYAGVPILHSTDSLWRTYDAAGNVYTSIQRVLACPTRLACDPSEQLVASAALTNYYAGDGRVVAAERVTSNDQLGQAGTSDNVMPYAAMGRGVYEEYRYDALGRRVWRRVHRDPYCFGVNPEEAPICASFIERTVYDGDQVTSEIRQLASDSLAVVESDAAGDGQYGVVAYLHGDEIDAPLALARARSADVKRLLLHRDWQGSIDFATLPGGEISDCGRPGAVENCESIAWPGLNMSVGFQKPVTNLGTDWWGTLASGNVNETGMIDLRARQYDPTTGTFLEEDPLGLAGGMNTYAFGGGDAVNFRDPSGMMQQAVQGLDGWWMSWQTFLDKYGPSGGSDGGFWGSVGGSGGTGAPAVRADATARRARDPKWKGVSPECIMNSASATAGLVIDVTGAKAFASAARFGYQATTNTARVYSPRLVRELGRTFADVEQRKGLASARQAAAAGGEAFAAQAGGWNVPLVMSNALGLFVPFYSSLTESIPLAVNSCR